MHGTFEWFGNYYLRNGRQIGFIAASDDHRSKPRLQFGLRLQRLDAVAAIRGVGGGNGAGEDDRRDLRRAQGAAVLRRDVGAAHPDRHGNERRRHGQAHSVHGATPAFGARVMGTAPITEAAVVKNGEVVYVKASVADDPAKQEPRGHWLRVVVRAFLPRQSAALPPLEGRVARGERQADEPARAQLRQPAPGIRLRRGQRREVSDSDPRPARTR